MQIIKNIISKLELNENRYKWQFKDKFAGEKTDKVVDFTNPKLKGQ